MATILDQGDILRVVVACKCQGQNGLNVFYALVKAVAGDNPTDQMVADGYSGNLAPLYKPLLNSTAQFYGVSVQRVWPVQSEPVTSDIGQDMGAATGDPLPTQITGLVTLRTGLAGRKNRGRKFIPFGGEGNNDASGDPNGDYLTGLTNIAGYLVGEHSYTSGANGVTVQAGLYRPTTHTVQLFNNYTVRTHWATQRRRGELRPGDTSPW